MPRNNYKQASNKARQQANLRQLDSLGTDQSEFEPGSEMGVVEAIAGEFIQRVQNNIQAQGLNVTGSMGELTIETQGTTVNIMAPNHLKYQDMGVNGAVVKLYNTPFSYKDKMPPISALKSWANNRGIRSVNNEKYGGKKSDIGNVWAIQRAVFERGIAPKNIFSGEVQQLVDDLSEAVADFAVSQLLNGFDD